MKNVILFVSVALAFTLNSCTFLDTPSQRDLQEQITQLQQEVAVLQAMNGLVPSYEIKNDSIASPMPENSDKAKNDGKKSAKTATEVKEQAAIDAIKYCLKMYEPDLKYTNIRSVPQSDGTVDVVIDYKWAGIEEHTYYNVTVYSNNEFKVNSRRGLEGDFPYGSKMMIP